MTDDDVPTRPVSGLVVLTDTPQGIPYQSQITPDREGNWQEVRAANEARRATPEWQARRAEEARRKQIEGERTFNKHFWSIAEVLSWIAYRCRAEMNTPHHRGTAYPLTDDAPKVEEAAAASKLLDSLQRPNNTLQAFADGVEISRATWGAVEYVNNPKRWPQGVFAREDVLREWPEIQERRQDLHVEKSALILGERNLPIEYGNIPEPNKSIRLLRAKETDIISVLANLSIEPPLSIPEIIRRVRRELGSLGKDTVVRDITPLLDHYPARLRRGENAATLASRKSNISDSNRSDRK